MNPCHPYNTNPIIVAEVAAAVRNAEERLADTFCAWPTLSHHERPIALRYAIMDLVTLYLSEPVRAEIWFDGLAKMLDISKADLQRLVERRADIINNIKELWKRQQAVTEAEVIGWML